MQQRSGTATCHILNGFKVERVNPNTHANPNPPENFSLKVIQFCAFAVNMSHVECPAILGRMYYLTA